MIPHPILVIYVQTLGALSAGNTLLYFYFTWQHYSVYRLSKLCQTCRKDKEVVNIIPMWDNKHNLRHKQICICKVRTNSTIRSVGT